MEGNREMLQKNKKAEQEASREENRFFSVFFLGEGAMTDRIPILSVGNGSREVVYMTGGKEDERMSRMLLLCFFRDLTAQRKGNAWPHDLLGTTRFFLIPRWCRKSEYDRNVISSFLHFGCKADGILYLSCEGDHIVTTRADEPKEFSRFARNHGGSVPILFTDRLFNGENCFELPPMVSVSCSQKEDSFLQYLKLRQFLFFFPSWVKAQNAKNGEKM